MIYFDHNATTPVKPAIIAEMSRVMSLGGNPSSVHQPGRKARSILEESRRTVAEAVCCRPRNIIFTSGGTESNGMALKAVRGIDHVIVAATEHDSLQPSEGRHDILPVNADGWVNPEDLQACLLKHSGHCLVSIMRANNETGVIQDIKPLVEIAHAAGALFHTDAIQALGKIPVDFTALGVDMMSLSGHKINGPQGVGALLVRDNIPLDPLYGGGRQEEGRRPGTENLAAIAGFAEAIRLLPDNLDSMVAVQALRDRIEQEISTHAPAAVFYGAKVPRLANTSSILMPGVRSSLQVMAFDLEGIAVSAGSACSSGKVTPSHVIAAMGGDEDQALSTIRVSLGPTNRAAEVDRFIAVWKKLYDRKQGARHDGKQTDLS